MSANDTELTEILESSKGVAEPSRRGVAFRVFRRSICRSDLCSLEKQTNLGRVLWQRFRAQGGFYFASIRSDSTELAEVLPAIVPRLRAGGPSPRRGDRTQPRVLTLG